MDTSDGPFGGSESSAPPSIQSALQFEASEYLPDIADFDLDETAKIELLRVLWDMMRSFVELGLDIQRIDPCGQIFDASQKAVPSTSCDVKSSFSTAIETPAGLSREEDE